MTAQASTLITFIFLALAICAVWLKPVYVGKRIAMPPWIAFFAASMVSGLVADVLNPLSIGELGIFCGAAYLARASKQKTMQRFFFSTVTVILALALALHRLPGFNNPVVISSMTLSTGAAAFTQDANFDKGAVGLILLAFLCNRTSTFSESGKLLKQIYPITLITVVAILGIAMGIGYIDHDFKITQTTMLFLVINLFFTVIAEETFFRGFLQDRLALSLARFRYGRLSWLCVLLCRGRASRRRYNLCAAGQPCWPWLRICLFHYSAN